MNGKIVVGAIALTALVAGIGGYWLQEYAYYTPVSFAPGQEIRLTALTGKSDILPVKDIQGIDGTSSPLKFRACFTTQESLATLTEGYKVYDGATPLNGPAWFTCFDAGKITAALASGEAVAFLGQADLFPSKTPLKPGDQAIEIDRVVAVFPDGRAYAWNQLAPGTDIGTGVEE